MLADVPINPENVATVLNTLRLIPDDVILDMATRTFNMDQSQTCIVGWALRDMLGQPHITYSWRAIDDAVETFGGTVDEWYNLYIGVCHFLPRGWSDEPYLPEIELAFVQRVDEAVKNSRKTSRR
jgi:hypothetical protein